MAAGDTPGRLDGTTGDRIRHIVARIVRVDVSELADDVRIRDELPMDSLMALQIVAACETEFQIHIDEREVAELDTVGEFVRHIASLSRQGPA